MKNYRTITAFLLAPASLCAQKQGTITYLEKIKMEIELDSATRAMIGDQFPSETSVEKLLLFNEEASLYTHAPKKEDKTKVMEENEGRRIEIKMDSPDEKIYTDLKNNRTIEQRDFMGKLFLLDTTLTKPSWKITGKQKNVLGYPCQQAMKTDKQDTTYAWFTAALPVSTGPMGLHGLPGMVMEMQMQQGKVNIVAQKVELAQPDTKIFTKPKEGKKVKPYEFKKIVEQKRKEMQEEYGGKGNVIIKIDHR